MPLEQFVLKHDLFAKAMRRVDPTIKLIAAGAMPDAMTGSKQAKRLNGQITVGQKPGVEVQEEALPSVPNAVVAPPFSVSIYSFAVATSGARPGAGQ